MAFKKITAEYGVDETLDKDGKVIRANAVLKTQLEAQKKSAQTGVDAIQAKIDILAK